MTDNKTRQRTKEQELKDLKEEQEEIYKERLISSLSAVNYYAITDNEEWKYQSFPY